VERLARTRRKPPGRIARMSLAFEFRLARRYLFGRRGGAFVGWR
jgi:hypothetical protein